MPFLDEPITGGLRAPGLLTPPKTPEVTTGGVLAAAARDENMLVSAWNFANERAGFVDDPNHNPIDTITGTPYEARHLSKFVGSRNEAETRAIMGRIDQEEADDRLLDAAGWGGTAARIGMGLLDPTLFLPVGAYYKGARLGGAIGKSALSLGAGAAAQATLSEGVLYGTQETRTLPEVAGNASAALVLGGLLGGAIGGMTSREIAKATTSIEALRAGIETERRTGLPQPAGAAVATREGLTLESALGAEKALARLSPVTRLQTSEFETAKATVRDLADAGMSYRQNWEGVPTSEGGTVETRVKMWNAPLYQAVAQMDDAYARYFFGKEAVSGFERRTAAMRAGWAGITGGKGGKLSALEFREEIGKAMARNDEHPIPQVAEAAKAFRAKVIDPAWKEAVALKMHDEGGEVLGAPSYITRVYNHGKITAESKQFHAVLLRNFIERRDGRAATLTREGKELDDFSRMSDAEAGSLVDSVINNIQGESALRIAELSIRRGEAGPLKSRVLDVPDELLEPWLIRDIEKIARSYTRSLAGDIELTRKFGDVQLKDQLSKLQDEYNAKKATAESGPDLVRLEREYKAAARDIGALRDRIRHTYAMPDNPDGWAYRAGKLALNANYMARLGGMTISSFPDLARPIMRYHLDAFRDGWLPLINSLSEFKLAAREIRLAGTGLDMVRDQRLIEIADLLDDYGRHTKFERGVQFAADRFGMVALMSPWNASAKALSGVITMAQVIRATRAVAEGNASAKQIKSLAANGIDDAMARKIWGQAKESGDEVNGVFLPNTESWTDQAALQSFRAALVREVDNLIVTPGLEKPLWTSKPLGRLIGQFKSFAQASTQRTMLAGLQQRDAAALAGVTSALALGALTAKIKSELRGEDTREWGKGRWAAEAIDNSGLLGILGEAGNIADKWTGGKVGLAWLGGKEVSRYQSRNAPGALLGPTFDFAVDAANVTQGIGADQMTRSHLHSMRQVLPLQNLFYLRGLIDKAERAIGDRMGLPERKQRQ